MTNALYIALWSYLFCMPLSEPGQVFGLAKDLFSKIFQTPEWVYKILIGCPKCHAGQVALWWQVFCVYKTGEFSLPFILVAIAGAYALQTWHLIVEKYLNR